MVNLLEHQSEFLESQHRHTGLVGGFRSGKSHIGIWKTISKKLQFPSVDVAYYLPTYPLIKDIAFPKFTEALTQANIPFTLNKSDKDIITPYGRIIMRSMDNPDLIVGYEVGYSLIDEADVLPKRKMEDVMVKILARNSVKSEGNNNATDCVSTPEGFRFLYDFFVKRDTDSKLLIRASTRNNPFISDSYIESLEETYTPELLRAYLEGEFVNLTSGAVYNHFDRSGNHSDREVQDGDILHIGLDFNVGAMAAIVHVIDEGNPIAVDEVVNAYKTEDICQILKGRYPNHRLFAYPDASGKAVKTSASITDIDTIKKAGINVRALKVNPNVKDRVNTMNKKLQDKSYLINTYKCPTYTDCLEQQPYRNGEPDKTLGLDHATDAGGYFIWHQFGKKKNQVFL